MLMASVVTSELTAFYDHREQIIIIKNSLHLDRLPRKMVDKVEPKRTIMRIKSFKFQVPSSYSESKNLCLIHKITTFNRRPTVAGQDKY